jgi:hypothetical protein
MASFTVNEREYFKLRWTVLDENAVASTPRSMRYRIDCQTTGKVLVDWTNVSISSTVTLAVPSSVNAIQSSSNPRETKVITVDTNYDDDDRVPAEYAWDVRNLGGL